MKWETRNFLGVALGNEIDCCQVLSHRISFFEWTDPADWSDAATLSRRLVPTVSL